MVAPKRLKEKRDDLKNGYWLSMERRPVHQLEKAGLYDGQIARLRTGEN